MLKKLFSGFKDSYMNYWNSFLFPAAAVSRLLKRNASPEIDTHKFSRVFDAAFYRILLVEAFLVKKRIPLPFGLSIVGTMTK